MEEIITMDGAGRLVLEPVAEEAVPAEVARLLVIRGRLPGPIPDHREQRAARIRELGGTEA